MKYIKETHNRDVIFVHPYISETAERISIKFDISDLRWNL